MEKQKSLVAIKEEIIGKTIAKIKALENEENLHLPPTYSAVNALNSAWLVLQEVQDRDKNLVLYSCTKSSIINSLLNMVVMGLNPMKQQGYFIAYGKSLSFQRSYHGAKAIAMMVSPDIKDIVAEVIYKGDVLEYSIEHGKKIIKKHTQKFEDINKKNILGGYCCVYGDNNRLIASEIMTMPDVLERWKNSKTNPVEPKGGLKKGSNHERFTASMVKRTLINHTLTPIINASSDSSVLLNAIKKTDEYFAVSDVIDEDIDDNIAIGEVIGGDNNQQSPKEEEPEVENPPREEPVDEGGKKEFNHVAEFNKVVGLAKEYWGCSRSAAFEAISRYAIKEYHIKSKKDLSLDEMERIKTAIGNGELGETPF